MAGHQLHKRFVNLTALLLSVCLFLGCGKALDSETEIPELLEPVGIAANYDIARLRDLTSVTLYNSVVAPYVTEYSFEKDEVFKKYAVAPGTEIKEGDPLAYAESRLIDRQISDLIVEIEELKENHTSEMDALNKDLLDAQDAEYKANSSLADLYAFQPDPQYKDAYAGWAAMALYPEGVYKRAKQNRERVEQSIIECEERFGLELQFKEDSLSRLQSKIKDSTLFAKRNGVLVDCAIYYGGDQVEEETPIMAVGDPTVKLLRTEYISKGTLAKAEDYYAIIGGKRYELVHEPMEQDEYNRLTADGETVYSSFFIEDPDNQVSLGQYAVVVIVKESRTNVICIPQDAVKVENGISYCYLADGENSIYTPIETGMKDGIYIEVLTGIQEGDKVLSTQNVTKGSHTETLSIGVCESEYESNGYMFYPYSEWLMNPVDEGKTYVKEILVTDYEAVSEGQTVMTLEVVSDQVEIERCRKRLDRLGERLKELQDIQYDLDARQVIDRENERAIAANLQEQRTVQKKLDKLTKYSGIVEVKAPVNGIITDVGYLKAGDLIYADAKLLQFADITTSYLVVRDDKGVLAYGLDATIEYADGTGAKNSIEGMVSTVGNTSLSKALVKDWALISIPEEVRSLMGASEQSDLGKWGRLTYKVKVSVRSMDQVVLVPKGAVETTNGYTYVNVVMEDGSVVRKNFVAGGSNNNYYWVIQGLDEGMTICWE